MHEFPLFHVAGPITDKDPTHWKQWRLARTKVRNLLKLGVSKGAAIPIAMSRKGPWNMSCTLATQVGMNNKWLKDQGVLSIKEIWVNIHYPATAR